MTARTMTTLLAAALFAGVALAAAGAQARGNGGGEGGGVGGGGGHMASAPVISHVPDAPRTTKPQPQETHNARNCGYNMTRGGLADVVAPGAPVRTCETVPR